MESITKHTGQVYDYEKDILHFNAFKERDGDGDGYILKSIKNELYEWTWRPKFDKSLEAFARHLTNMYYDILVPEKTYSKDYESGKTYYQDKLF